jgi:excisionase family DNA binding protein
MSDSLLSVNDLATYLGVPMATVYAWNSRGIGPKRYRLGKHVRYRRTDVAEWLDQQAAPTGLLSA